MLGERIDEWAALRSQAETGTLSDDAHTEIERMIKGVRDFVNDHLF